MSATSKRSAARSPSRGWVERHLDGWQAGALALVLAGGAVFLAVPRAVEPLAPPPPLVDGAALADTMASDDERAARAVREPLDVDIRAVGRELRTYNGAAARGLRREMGAARKRTIEATRRALGRSEDELLTLRAYQLVAFLAELRRWQRSGTRSVELDELGGDFLELVQRNRWCAGPGRSLVPDERVVRAFYKRRWNELTGADSGPFALTVDEERVRFGFLLQHPLLPRGFREPRTPLERARLEGHRLRQQLALVRPLGEADPSYPVELARGALLYRMQRFGPATEAFRTYLERSPDGPYALRAQNYFKAAIDRTRQGLF